MSYTSSRRSAGPLPPIAETLTAAAGGVSRPLSSILQCALKHSRCRNAAAIPSSDMPDSPAELVGEAGRKSLGRNGIRPPIRTHGPNGRSGMDASADLGKRHPAGLGHLISEMLRAMTRHFHIETWGVENRRAQPRRRIWAAPAMARILPIADS